MNASCRGLEVCAAADLQRCGGEGPDDGIRQTSLSVAVKNANILLKAARLMVLCSHRCWRYGKHSRIEALSEEWAAATSSSRAWFLTGRPETSDFDLYRYQKDGMMSHPRNLASQCHCTAVAGSDHERLCSYGPAISARAEDESAYMVSGSIYHWGRVLRLIWAASVADHCRGARPGSSSSDPG